MSEKKKVSHRRKTTKLNPRKKKNPVRKRGPGRPRKINPVRRTRRNPDSRSNNKLLKDFLSKMERITSSLEKFAEEISLIDDELKLRKMDPVWNDKAHDVIEIAYNANELIKQEMWIDNY